MPAMVSRHRFDGQLADARRCHHNMNSILDGCDWCVVEVPYDFHWQITFQGHALHGSNIVRIQ